MNIYFATPLTPASIYFAGSETFCIKPFLLMRPLVLVLLLAIPAVWELKAQQLPMFTQYAEMHGALNPAIISQMALAGDYRGYVGASARMQWAGRPGAPRTQLVHGQWLTGNSNFSALLGGHFVNDQAGQLGFTGVYGRISSVYFANKRYREEAGFAAGLTFGAVQFRVKLDNVIARDAQDPILLEGNINRIYPDVGFGIYAWQQLGRSGVTIYGGISVPQTLGINFEYQPAQGDQRYSLKRLRHYYAMGGMIKELGRSGSYIDISSWVKYVPNAPVNADLNIRLFQTVGDAETLQIWIGSGYNTANAMHFELGFVPGYDGKLKIGYCYDFNVSGSILKFGNSHEINLAMMLGE